jgi:hypothetical protein
MENKELDCVLVNAIDEAGYVWSFTIRGENVDDLFEKMGEVSLRFEKQGYSPSGRPSFAPKPSAPPTQPTSSKTKRCEMHDIEMEERVSKSTGKAYFSHYDKEHGICFGSGYKGKPEKTY